MATLASGPSLGVNNGKVKPMRWYRGLHYIFCELESSLGTRFDTILNFNLDFAEI